MISSIKRIEMQFFKICFIFFSCILFSCQSQKNSRIELARVYDSYLYLDQIPSAPHSVDSVIFVQNYINQWATQKILIKKAEFNLDRNLNYVDSLVDVYRESLLIHYYKEAMIQEYLNDFISDSLINLYYLNNIENFQLKEDIVKLNYIKIKSIAPNINFVSEKYTSLDLVDVEKLEEYCLQFAERFFLGDVDWVSWSDFAKTLPVSENLHLKDGRRFLRQNKKIELKDSIYQYFIFIQDFKLKGSSSPLDYVSSLIQKILINKKKKDLMNDIEHQLIEDALSTNNFEIYE
ncbi:MAG: hypothetical protein CMD23_00180 [Flavobacteriales bacterium]|nr:hypothetical protein [Flavobacteriales bacterium]|tara:strand:+ start:148 stop:1020 length:873 start_codon:yes stop_codon:yes gene_type:complete